MDPIKAPRHTRFSDQELERLLMLVSVAPFTNSPVLPTPLILLTPNAGPVPAFVDLGITMVTVGQKQTLLTFLHENRFFGPNLLTCVKSVKWNSDQAKPYGGLAYLDKIGEIVVLHQPETTPDAFVKMFLHETGHATFERVLLGGCPSTTFVTFLEGTHSTLVPKLEGPMDEMAALFASMEAEYGRPARPARPATPPPVAFCPEALAFYAAWCILREQDGIHLLGVDFGNTIYGPLTAQQRRKYQADAFHEFCAETFMLYALNHLGPFVKEVELTLHGTLVQKAWTAVYEVLRRIARPILVMDCRAVLAPLNPIILRDQLD